MIGYSLWVLLGLAAAALALRLQPASGSLAPGDRQLLRLAALAGAIVGAYGLQLPADLAGWNAPLPAGIVGDALPLGGRTVLGGLLGGWLAVELGKRSLGIRTPTGDEFALPLALALCCGRLGCLCAGCCAGRMCPPVWYACIDAAGTPRWPVQAAEAIFHGLCAGLLLWAAKRGAWPGRRLAAYLTAYAAARFTFEFWRQNPVVALGLSWHQWLAIVLAIVAGRTWWARARAVGQPEPRASCRKSP